MEKLNRKEKPLKSKVIQDNFTAAAEKAFDCVSNGVSEYYPWEKPTVPEEFGMSCSVCIDEKERDEEVMNIIEKEKKEAMK